MVQYNLQLRTNKVNKFGGHHTLIFCDLNYMWKWKVTLQTLNWDTYEDICMSRLSIKGHLRVFGLQNLVVCQNNILKIWKYAQSTDLDGVVLILKYEKILASHSHGKKCTKYAYQLSQVPMFVQNQPQITTIYQKMITGHTSCSQIHLQSHRIPQNSSYIGHNLGWKLPKIWRIPISRGKNFKCYFSDRWIRIWSPFGPRNSGSSYIGFCRLWLSATVVQFERCTIQKKLQKLVWQERAKWIDPGSNWGPSVCSFLHPNVQHLRKPTTPSTHAKATDSRLS